MSQDASADTSTVDERRGGAPAQERKLRAQGRKTLGKLMEAAIEVFGQRGYNAARVDDIVRLAQTSHGTFYLYFSNKQDLLRALLEDCVEDMSALAAELADVAPSRKGVATLRAWLESYMDLYDDYWPVIHAWSEAEVQGVEFGRLGTAVLGNFSALFAERIRDTRHANGVDPDIAGLAFVAMIERFNYYVETRQIDFARDDVLDTLAVIAHRGVFGGR